MRINVQYIPLKKIKPNLNLKITDHVKKLRSIMWDCMHILVVKKEVDGSYTIISGHDRFEYLQKHTKNKTVPCIIDEHSLSREIKYWFFRLFHLKREKVITNSIVSEKLSRNSASIVRTFLKEEHRFEQLSSVQKAKVLILAIRYKRTVITSMKKMVYFYNNEKK